MFIAFRIKNKTKQWNPITIYFSLNIIKGNILLCTKANSSLKSFKRNFQFGVFEIIFRDIEMNDYMSNAQIQQI